MELSRRFFLGAVASVIGATALPAMAFADVPVVYGDGVHDDGPGLNAWFRGEPVRFAGEELGTRNGDAFYLRDGHFRIDQTLHVPGDVNIDGCRFHGERIAGAQPVILIGENARGVLTNNHLFGPSRGYCIQVGQYAAPRTFASRLLT